MPALNFMARFADAVESGEKRQTIRKRRKDGRDPKPGDTLYLYTGMRTKRCRKLGEARCTFVGSFTLDGKPFESMEGAWLDAEATLNSYPVDRSEYTSLEELAVRDGFKSEVEMLNWFRDTHGLPFEGLLIRW